jgi:hypothetical protein
VFALAPGIFFGWLFRSPWAACACLLQAACAPACSCHQTMFSEVQFFFCENFWSLFPPVHPTAHILTFEKKLEIFFAKNLQI